MAQLLLDFPNTIDFSSENYLLHKGNQEATQALLQPWPTQRFGAVIYGAQGVGKTHLLKVYCAHYGVAYARAENLPPLAEVPLHLAVDVEKMPLSAQSQELLFHVFNHLNQLGGTLVLALPAALKELDLLPDLASRLHLLEAYELVTPDEDMLRQLIAKWAYEKQLALPENVVRYLLERVERAPARMQKVLAGLDALSLQQKRGLTVPLVRDFLQRFGTR